MEVVYIEMSKKCSDCCETVRCDYYAPFRQHDYLETDQLTIPEEEDDVLGHILVELL